MKNSCEVSSQKLVYFYNQFSNNAQAWFGETK